MLHTVLAICIDRGLGAECQRFLVQLRQDAAPPEPIKLLPSLS